MCTALYNVQSHYSRHATPQIASSVNNTFLNESKRRRKSVLIFLKKAKIGDRSVSDVATENSVSVLVLLSESGSVQNPYQERKNPDPDQLKTH